MPQNDLRRCAITVPFRPSVHRVWRVMLVNTTRHSSRAKFERDGYPSSLFRGKILAKSADWLQKSTQSSVHDGRWPVTKHLQPSVTRDWTLGRNSTVVNLRCMFQSRHRTQYQILRFQVPIAKWGIVLISASDSVRDTPASAYFCPYFEYIAAPNPRLARESALGILKACETCFLGQDCLVYSQLPKVTTSPLVWL